MHRSGVSLLGHAYPGNKHWPAIPRSPDMRSTLGLVKVGVGGPDRQWRRIWRQFTGSLMRP